MPVDRSRRGNGFRLERVLAYRRRLTDAAEQRLASAVRERQDVEASLERLRHARVALTEYLVDRSAAGSLDLASLVAADAYDERLRAQARAQDRARAAALARESAARAELLDRRVDQRILERLKERTLRELRQRDAALQQKALDEIATLRHARSGLNGARHGG
ncbi:MAG: flagellar export protein FliJ [Sphaerobacter sp.]|nr:flagellar export protein FliJ [Sphaerobacter sp.]